MKKSVSSGKSSITESWTCGACDPKKCILWTIVAVVVAFAISFFAAKCAVQNMEVMRAGGSENYKMIKQLYKSDAWKQTQAMQIQQTMQALEGQAAGALVPTETTTEKAQ